MKRSLSIMVVIIPILLSSPRSLVMAQSWFNLNDGRALVSLEALFPDFKADEISSFNPTIFLMGQVPLSENVYFIAEIPFTHTSFGCDACYGYYESSGSQDALGNPYVGIKYGSFKSPYSAEIGLRFPMALDKYAFARSMGQTADIQRLGTFYTGAFALSANAAFCYAHKSGLMARFVVGPIYLINAEKYTRYESYLHYALQGGIAVENYTIMAGITGLTPACEGNLNYGCAFLHQLSVSLSARFGSFQPCVQFRLPLNEELRRRYSSVIGVGFNYYLREF